MFSQTGITKTIRRLKQRETAKPDYQALESYALSMVKYEWSLIDFSKTDTYYGVTLVRVENGFEIRVEGEEVLFLEFGAGIRYSNTRHPLASKMGFGAGTYPGVGHWNKPWGWWFPVQPGHPRIRSSNATLSKLYSHTYGNPAYAPTYKALTKIKNYMLARDM